MGTTNATLPKNIKKHPRIFVRRILFIFYFGAAGLPLWDKTPPAAYAESVGFFIC